MVYGGMIGQVNSTFDWCLKYMSSNPTEAGHCITTVGKLFTLTVTSGAEGRLNQLTPGIAGTYMDDRQPSVHSCTFKTFGGLIYSIAASKC